MEDFLRSFLLECGGLDDEFGEELRKQLATVGMDVDQLVDIAAKGMETHLTPIPPILHSLYDGPFERCLVCKVELLSPPKEYLILRMFRHEEPTTEYAICSGCNDLLWGSFSGDTRARTTGESSRCVDEEERRTRLSNTANGVDFDIEPWIAKCLFTGKPREACDTYQILAKCVGPRLAPWVDGPWMRSGDSLRHTWKLWSKESRDSHDDFVETYLGPTPSLAKEIPHPLAIELLSI